LLYVLVFGYTIRFAEPEVRLFFVGRVTSLCFIQYLNSPLACVLSIISFLMYFIWKEHLDGRLLVKHQHQSPLITIAVVPDKPPQYTTIKGFPLFPWSWIGSVSPLLSPVATWQWICVRVNLQRSSLPCL
jgi:hypothetical protein